MEDVEGYDCYFMWCLKFKEIDWVVLLEVGE